MADDKRVEFLRELAKLSRKYDMWIGACGCCGGASTSTLPPDCEPEYAADPYGVDHLENIGAMSEWHTGLTSKDK